MFPRNINDNLNADLIFNVALINVKCSIDVNYLHIHTHTHTNS